MTKGVHNKVVDIMIQIIHYFNATNDSTTKLGGLYLKEASEIYINRGQLWLDYRTIYENSRVISDAVAASDVWV